MMGFEKAQLFIRKRTINAVSEQHMPPSEDVCLGTSLIISKLFLQAFPGKKKNVVFLAACVALKPVYIVQK